VREQTTIFLRERSELESKIRLLEEQIVNYESKLMPVLEENNKLNNFAGDRIDEINFLRQEVEKYKSERADLQRHYDNVKERVGNLESKIEALLKDNEK
jgi:phage shock protein A